MTTVTIVIDDERYTKLLEMTKNNINKWVLEQIDKHNKKRTPGFTAQYSLPFDKR